MQQTTSWLAQHQLLDSALPVGAFSHSFGLETFIQNGEVSDARGLYALLESLLRANWAPCDALLIKGVYHLSEPEIWKLDTLQDASRVSRETSEGIRRIGRQALKLGKSLLPRANWGPLEQAIISRQCAGSWPLVFGWWAREIGMPLDAAVTGYLYTNCQAALSGAVRLSLIGQTTAQAMLTSLYPAIEGAWREVEDREPFDWSTSTFLLEVAQLEHELLEARLFMS